MPDQHMPPPLDPLHEPSQNSTKDEHPIHHSVSEQGEEWVAFTLHPTTPHPHPQLQPPLATGHCSVSRQEREEGPQWGTMASWEHRSGQSHGQKQDPHKAVISRHNTNITKRLLSLHNIKSQKNTAASCQLK